MRNTFKSSIHIFLFGALLLAGCSENNVNLQDGNKHTTEEMNEVNLQDSNKHITDEMNEVISDYIIHKNSSSSNNTEKQFEVHKVYGTDESDGVISVYMWSYYGGFNKSTGLEVQTGHSLPAVIRLSAKEGNYAVIEYTETQDGDSYQPSLEKMFPQKYLELAQQDNGNVRDLQNQMDKKVKHWLDLQG